VTGDRAYHNLLDRPRDAPWRTAIGTAFVTWVFLVFLAGAADRASVFFGLSYTSEIWAFRVLVWVIPLLVLFATKRACEELLRIERTESVRKAAEAEA